MVQRINKMHALGGFMHNTPYAKLVGGFEISDILAVHESIFMIHVHNHGSRSHDALANSPKRSRAASA
jgi:hypothetical protein